MRIQRRAPPKQLKAAIYKSILRGRNTKMNEIAFAAYLLETLLHEVFHSKRRMARELDVTLRTLQLNMKAGENSKAANRATLGAVFYCCEHRIDIQGIYDRFVATKKGILSSKIKRFSEISIVKGVRTHPGCISLYPSPRLDKALSSDYNEQGMAHGKGYCQELCAKSTASLMKLVRRRPNRPRACSAWLPISGPPVVRQGWRSHLRSP